MTNSLDKFSDIDLIAELEKRGYPKPWFGFIFGRGGDLVTEPTGKKDGVFHFFINGKEVNRDLWHEKQKLLEMKFPFGFY
jgi:hypothetical protein